MTNAAIFLVFSTVVFAVVTIALRVLVRSRTGEPVNGRLAYFPLLMVALSVAVLVVSLTWQGA